MNSEALRRKTMEELISVVVITYNQEQTIGRTLDSILMQQCHLPIEIVIGEDCSTDATLAVCQDYQRRFPDQIRLFANEQNKGVVDNYFDCLLASRGKYIADCAGDDFWTDPLKLEKEARFMHEHPDVSLVHTAWHYYKEGRGLIALSGQQPFSQTITDGKKMLEAIVMQTRFPVIHLCTALYRKAPVVAAMKMHGSLFRGKDLVCEDLQIAFVLAQAGKIGYMKESTLAYNMGDETISRTNSDARQFRFVRGVSNIGYELVSSLGLHSAALNAYFRYRVFALAMHAFRAFEPSLRLEVIKCMERWHVRPDVKTCLVLFVTLNRVVWRVALLLRQGLLPLKRRLSLSNSC